MRLSSKYFLKKIKIYKYNKRIQKPNYSGIIKPRKSMKNLIISAIFFFLIGTLAVPSFASAPTIVDGDLITTADSSDIYIVKVVAGSYGHMKFKRLILNPEIFNSYGHLRWENVKTVEQYVLDAYTLSELVIEVNPGGSVADPKVYKVSSDPNSDAGEKRWLNVSSRDFRLLGYVWESIYHINHTEASPDFYITKSDITHSDTLTEPTPVGGIIAANTTWTLENSPYLVTANILVSEGVTLTIEPGVLVEFEKASLTQVGVHSMQVDGTLVAKGTDSKKIVFTSYDAGARSWGGIYFSDKSSDWNEEDETGSIIQHCIIEYGISLISARGSSPLISDNILRNGGLHADENSKIINNKIRDSHVVVKGDVHFSDNEISGGTVSIEGDVHFSDNEISVDRIFYGPRRGRARCSDSATIIRNNIISTNGFLVAGGSPTIMYNDISGSQLASGGSGISPFSIGAGSRGALHIVRRCGATTSTIITHNSIIGNIDAIVIEGSVQEDCKDCDITFEHNNIYNNVGFFIFMKALKGSSDLSNNWWGTTDISLIESSIYDFDNDDARAKVNYLPIATSEFLDAGVK